MYRTACDVRFRGGTYQNTSLNASGSQAPRPVCREEGSAGKYPVDDRPRLGERGKWLSIAQLLKLDLTNFITLNATSEILKVHFRVHTKFLGASG